ncbi:hypothetical protein T4C_5422 [Trichinella pseudospiralis]|uniref:Uncharacterized protein n=1 Tax=Trichinella pseudospiralis TaxID=6337 RepID=A0A0V1JGE5_TRIPS|nr:hypothetical protein T4C_5422 [Trichinella pseudospiralis]
MLISVTMRNLKFNDSTTAAILTFKIKKALNKVCETVHSCNADMLVNSQQILIINVEWVVRCVRVKM